MQTRPSLFTEGDYSVARGTFAALGGFASSGFSSFLTNKFATEAASKTVTQVASKTATQISIEFTALLAGEALISTVEEGLLAAWEKREFSAGQFGKSFLINMGIGWAFSKITKKLDYPSGSDWADQRVNTLPDHYKKPLIDALEKREQELDTLATKLFNDNEYITLFRKEYDTVAEKIKNTLEIEVGTGDYIPKSKAAIEKAVQAHSAVKDFPSSFTSFSHTKPLGGFSGEVFTLQVSKKQFKKHFIFGNEYERELLLIGRAKLKKYGIAESNYWLINAGIKPPK